MGQRAPSVLRRGIVACTISHVEVPSGPSSGCGGDRQCMFMAGQLLYREGSGADSAGNTRSPPSTPRLLGLRRGSHTARHSTAAGCWQPQNWHRTGCGCGAENHRSVLSFGSDRRRRLLGIHFDWRCCPPKQIRKGYVCGQPAAPRSTSWRRQCRKHPATTPNPASAGAQTRIT